MTRIIFKIQQYLYLSIISSILLGCTKDDIQLSTNEIGILLETVSYQNIGTGGVILTGSIQNLSGELDYGFALTSIKGSTSTLTQDIEFKSGSPKGEYSFTISTGLVEGRTYYYNAVVRADGKFYYGKEKSFISNGSARPVIQSITPIKASLSDTLTIKGKFFSEAPKLLFDNIESTPFVTSDSVIKAIVPVPSDQILFSTEQYNRIKIINKDNQESTSDEFSLYTPRIDSIVPREVHDLDTLRVYGAYFDNEIRRNRLTTEFEGREFEYEILHNSDTLLVLKPMQLRQVEPTIRLQCQLQTVMSKIKSSIPHITGVSANCLAYGDDLTIYGTNLPVSESAPWVKFGNTYMHPRIKTRDSMVINFSNDARYYDGFENNFVSVIHLGQEIVGVDPICITSPWLKIGRDTNLHYPTLMHTYNNETFILSKGYFYGDLVNRIFRKIPESMEFVEVTNNWVPEKLLHYSGTKNEFNNSKLYSYYFYTSSEDKYFSSYDIFTNKEEVLADFPGEDRDNGIMVSLGDYIYLGLGATYQKDFMSDIWKYSIKQNTWELVLTNFPGIDSYESAKVNPLVFTVEDKIYIGSGQPETGQLDFWELDTSTNQVSMRADMPVPTTRGIVYHSTTIGDKTYFQNELLFEYDATKNIWTKRDTNGEKYLRAGYLNENGIIYMLYNSDKYELNPSYLE